MIGAFLTTVLFSLSAVSANRSVAQLGSNLANFLRLALAALALGVWAHTMGGGLEGAAVWIFILSGFIGFGLGDIGVFHALPRLGSRLTVLFAQCLAAPIAGITEWLWLGTTLTWAEIGCVVIILGGIVLALAPGKGLHRSAGVIVAGTLFGLLAAVGQGVGAVVSRKAYMVAELAGQQVDGSTAAYQRVLGGVVVAFAFWAVERMRHQPSPVGGQRPARRNVAGWIALNAATGPILGVSAYQWALGSTPSGIVLPIVALTPIVVIPFAYWFEREIPSKRSLLGGAIAVGGSVALAIVITGG